MVGVPGVGTKDGERDPHCSEAAALLEVLARGAVESGSVIAPVSPH